MEGLSLLHGSCACERNQYIVTIPRAATSQAHVFFDNSAANRRSQAAPTTAWLRIPLAWFNSSTHAQFPDETHTSIRRTYYDRPLASVTLSRRSTPFPAPSPTRRQFCGYCGTHLTAWNDARSADGIDVTLGSLERESLDVLGELDLLPGGEDEEEEEESEGARGEIEGGLVRGGTVDDEEHIPTSETETEAMPGLVQGGTIDAETHIPTTETSAMPGLLQGGTVDAETHIPITASTTSSSTNPNIAHAPIPPPLEPDIRATAVLDALPRFPRSMRFPHQLHHPGMPFFEELVDDSPFGRIRRRRGGEWSVDGGLETSWEVVEIDGSNLGLKGEGEEVGAGDGSRKRVKITR